MQYPNSAWLYEDDPQCIHEVWHWEVVCYELGNPENIYFFAACEWAPCSEGG